MPNPEHETDNPLHRNTNPEHQIDNMLHRIAKPEHRITNPKQPDALRLYQKTNSILAAPRRLPAF